MYGSKHRTTDGLYESRKDGNGHSSTKREWNLQPHETNDDSSNHRKYIRTQSSTNNRTVPSSSSSQQQRQNGDKNKKTVQDTKKPLRIFGDWSEFKSSTGKTYFYNCKTEVSRWEKPKGWPADESSHRSSTSKKESTNVSISPSVHSRYKMEESSSSLSKKSIPNGIIHSHESTEISNNRLPSPTDDNSRMSLSSTSSKESSAIVHSSLSEPVSSDIPKKDSILVNGNRKSSEQITENESPAPLITKAERDQEMQKYYRADLIRHLTDWPATQLEKQCLKLFDEYYGYSAKMSTTFIELKALKSNFRILEIKRGNLTQRLLRCKQHVKEREDNKLL